jgi:hypothetical protein
MKSRPKYGFKGYSDSGLKDKLQHIIDSLTGNPNFLTPVPTLVVLQDKVDAYAQALADAQSRDEVAVSEKNDLRDELEVLFKALAGYVMNITSDRTVILTSGFDATGPSDPVGHLPAPQLKIESGQGMVRIDISPIRGAANYIVEMCDIDPQLPEAEFYVIGNPTASRFEAACPPLQYRWIRVRANGSAGEGDNSAIVRVSAL